MPYPCEHPLQRFPKVKLGQDGRDEKCFGQSEVVDDGGPLFRCALKSDGYHDLAQRGLAQLIQHVFQRTNRELHRTFACQWALEMRPVAANRTQTTEAIYQPLRMFRI